MAESDLPNSGWFPFLCLRPLQVAKEFILKSEQDGFIRRICDIIQRVETLLHKDGWNKDQGTLSSPEAQCLSPTLAVDGISVSGRSVEAEETE